eukprot:10308.XXX_59211_59342_1 [CDS] Oithona nana genome sequencing.
MTRIFHYRTIKKSFPYQPWLWRYLRMLFISLTFKISKTSFLSG